jgi:hypothetical protein
MTGDLPPAWQAIADAVRRAAGEGQAITCRRKLTQVAGLRGTKGEPHPDVTAMVKAGVLLTEVRERRGVGRQVRFGLRDGTWTAWPAILVPSTYDLACKAIRTAAMGGAGYGTARALGTAAGMPASTAADRVLGLCKQGHLLREARPRPGIGQEVSWVIVETGERSPWALAPVAGWAAKASANDGEADGSRAGGSAMKAMSHKIRLHRMRMERAKPQTEAELRAIVDAHIAAHGVTRIEPPPVSDVAFGLPVRGHGGRAVGDGATQARSR